MTTKVQSVPEVHVLPHVRPRFRLPMSCTAEVITGQFKSALASSDCPVVGSAHKAFTTLKLPVAERHYWSPQLTIVIEEIPEEGIWLMRGVYGPRPRVWTMFVFFYFTLGLLAVFIGIIGSSNLTMGQPATILWLLPLLLLLLGSMYGVSRYGERLAQDQMYTLHSFVEQTLDVRFADTHD